jgi:hypothetical protein
LAFSSLRELEIQNREEVTAMAGAKSLQGIEADDLAEFANEQNQFYGTVPVPAGARIVFAARGHKLMSQKLIDANGQPLRWTGIQEAQPARARAG